MSPFVALFMGIWAPLALALMLGAIVLSYQIEKRSPDLANRTGLPRYALWLHTATNYKVARDSRTQLLRTIMLALFAGIVALFLGVAWAVSTIERV